MDKKYELVVGNKRIEVNENVYRAYYKEREHEKYLHKKALDNEYSFEGILEEGISFEYKSEIASPSPEQLILKAIEMQAVRDAVAKLREEEQNLLHMYFYENKTERQIALILGLRQQSLNEKKTRILKKLKKLL